MERFQRLYGLDSDLYLEGSPLVISAGELLKDTKDGRVLVHLKLKNIYEARLTSCKIAIKAFEPNGNELNGIDEFSYLDLSVEANKFFGSDTPVYLPNNITRKIEVAVIEAVYEDNFVWTHEYKNWFIIEKPSLLSEKYIDKELIHQYQIETKINALYEPRIYGAAFWCSCGALSYGNKCNLCGSSFAHLRSILDDGQLEQRKNSRVEAEKENLYQKLIKRYENASSEDECNILKAEFEEVIDYKESEKYVALLKIKAEEKRKEEKYEAAILDANSSDLDRLNRAVSTFEFLNDFKESKNKMDETKKKIQKLEAKKRNKKLCYLLLAVVLIILIFISAYTYRLNENYKLAKKYFEEKDYDKAYEEFAHLGIFLDSREMAKETKYEQAKLYLEKNEYESAYSILEELGSYQDSDELATEVKQKIEAINLAKEKVTQGIAIMFSERKEALVLFEDAAEAGNEDAQFLAGYMYDREGQNFKSEDFEKARMYYEKVIDTNPYAMICLGYMYKNGYGVNENKDKADELFGKAKQLIDKSRVFESEYAGVEAFLIGKLYNHGDGFEQDYLIAKDWYEKAADLGNPSAMNNIGLLYSDGLGVNKDIGKAIDWYEDASEKDNLTAMLNLALMYINDDEWTDYSKAFSLFEKASEAGNKNSLHYLAGMYLHGYGVEQNTTRAVELYTQEANLGLASGMNGMGDMYYYGFGDAKIDYEKAIEWYEKSSKLGNSYGKNGLGMIYSNPYYKNVDYPKALQYFVDAAQEGNVLAMDYAAGMYLYGIGTKKNAEKAKEWFEKAAELGDEKAKEMLLAEF